MTYYLLLKGDTEKDVIFDTNVWEKRVSEYFTHHKDLIYYIR